MKKSIFTIFIISTSLIMLLMLILKTQGISIFFSQISKLERFWIFSALLCMFLYWLFESMSLHIITLFHGEKMRRRESFSITMMGQFFNAITPFSTGGQPAQALFLASNGMNIGNATSIVMMKFFVYQTVLTVYSLLVILLSFSHFNTSVPFLITMAFLGLAVHASMIVFTLLFSYNKAVTEKILRFIFKMLKKFRIVKDAVSSEKKLEDSLSCFHDNAELLRNNLKILFETSTLTFLQLSFFFAIPYCIYRSFGFTNASFFYIFAATVFVSTIISIVPLPGATGGAEGGFYLFFGLFFDSISIVPAILIWRIITYYACIGVGGIFAVILPKLSNRTSK